MPNFQTYSISVPDLPARYADSDFLYKAVSKRGEILIMTRYKEETCFFIKIVKKQDKFLVKGDNITRPSQVVFLQNALKDFKNLTKTETLFSNIDYKKNKIVKRYKNVVDIEYFLNSFKYDNDKKIFIEIGFGSGRHILYQAKHNQNAVLIGLEIHKPSLEQVAKQCELQNINNILLLNYDARIFLEFIKSNSIDKIFIHFPIPWDKKPHRRVISEDFINETLRVLKKNATLELRTDSENYFEYSLKEFLKLRQTTIHINKNKNLPISSKYEDRWKRLEKNIYDIIFVNNEISEEKAKMGKLKFEKTYDFEKIEKSFIKLIEVRDDFFVHIEEMYKIDPKEGILKLSFGSSFKNEKAYILCLKDKTSYFPDNIIATKANEKAHNLIKEWLNGICSKIK